MDQSIEIWRACGIGFFACVAAFSIGVLIGNERGWKRAKDLLAPRHLREK